MEAHQGQQEISSQQFIIPGIETDPEAATAEHEKPFAEFQSAVKAVAISPQGRTRIAVGLEDGTVEIWDFLTGKNWSRCQGHTDAVNSVAFSPDGSMVVSGSFDNTVRLWDVNTGEAIGQLFSGHTGSVNSLAFNPDGNTVASSSKDKTVRLWDVQTGEAIGQLYSHAQPVTSVAFSPDGNTIVSGSWDNTVWLWDLNTEEAIGQSFSGHTKPVLSVAFSPDGNTIVSGSWDNTVRLWDIETGEAIGQPFSGHTDSVTSVAFSPDGSMVVSGSWDNTVRLWDIETGEAIGQPFSGHTSSVTSVAFSPDGSMVVSGSDDGTVRLWNVETGIPVNQVFSGHIDTVNSIAFSPDGSMVVSGSEDSTMRLWNVETGKAIGQPFSGHTNPVTSVAFSPDGNTVVSASEDITVQLWNVETGIPVNQDFFGHTNPVTSVAFSPDGNTVVSGSEDITVRLWNVETGTAIGQPFSGHTNPVTSVAFSPDGKTVVSGSWDKTVRLWDVQTGTAIGQPFFGHTDSVISVAFSADGNTIVSGSLDNTVRLWNVETREAIGQPFSGHKYLVNSVAFSPDGSMVVSGSADKTVRIWDISDPQRKRQIIIGEHEGEVHSVVFDPLGDYIISAGGDGIKVWRWQKFNIRRVPQAFRNDQPTGEDSLDVAKELQSLADVLMLRSLEPPLAVAILGSWGSGKSFGMHLIEKQITKIRCQQISAKQTWSNDKDDPNLSPYVGHVYQIKFNAWSYAKSDLWASLMQTIFDQLDRQLTLEQQLGKVSDLLAGGDIWRVVNQMNDSDRKAILELELGKDVFAKLADGNVLWDILSEVREEEQKKLEQTEQELQSLETEVQKENEIIAKEVNQEFENKSRIIVFLTQLKELSKDKFGDSILKDFLNTYDFKDKKDLENQFPIFKNLAKLEESHLTEKVESLIKTEDGKIKDFIKKSAKIKNFVEEQPSKIVGLIEFIKKDEKILIIFIATTSLPFIVYFLLSLLPFIKELFSALKIWLTIVATTPAMLSGIEIFKKLRIFQAKTSRLFKVAKESVEQEKQKLAIEKEKKIQDEIKNRNSENQQKIVNLQTQIERQKQRIGLTAQYKSLLDFVNNRLEDDSYQKLLGLMHQIQDDLADLSDHLTYKSGNTNPEKLEVLKKHFPRGPARIVLYIDDLDRCPPDKVVQVLEAVQLLLNTEIFVIVLAIDDRYIGRSLEEIYRGVLKRGGTPSGVDYLEKIIQIPYRMRPISKEVTASYLKSLVDIEEESKQDSREDLSRLQQVNKESSFLQQTTEKDEIKFLEELPEKVYQDEIEEIPADIEEKVDDDDNLSVSTPTKNPDIKGIYEPKTKKDNSEESNKKIQYSANTDPLVSFERFTAEEFTWISESCQHVDLTPRTAKRLINICKIIKIIWTPVPNDTIWKQEPEKEYKQTLIAFLALAGRYHKEMRKLLEEIYLEFEEEDTDKVIINKDKWLNRLQNQDVFIDRHNHREWKKFKNDFLKMSPRENFVFEKRTFNLAVSFCFVGDIGYDPDDNYHREYRFEDQKKEYGFKSMFDSTKGRENS